MFQKSIICALVLLSSLIDTRGQAEADAVPPLQPINASELPHAWQVRLQGLQDKERLEVEFEEARYFAFRREPKVYRGVFRRAASGSISLAYKEPELLVLHVEKDSITVRKGDGGYVRELPESRADKAGLEIFRSVLGLDLSVLSEQYHLFGGLEGRGWILECRVKEGIEPAPKYSLLRLQGSYGQLHEIELQEDPRRRVEIKLGPPEYPESFSPELMEKFFPEKTDA